MKTKTGILARSDARVLVYAISQSLPVVTHDVLRLGKDFPRALDVLRASAIQFC
jgi:hypothetical protein